MPKVKFALFFYYHLLYLLLLCTVLLVETDDLHSFTAKGIITGNWMLRTAELPHELSAYEMLLWLWTLADLSGELYDLKRSGQFALRQ